jgi:hypothetical protein
MSLAKPRVTSQAFHIDATFAEVSFGFGVMDDLAWILLL